MKPTLEHNAAALKRWRSRLSRAIRMVEKLERQRKRLEMKPRTLSQAEIVQAIIAKPTRPRAHADIGNPSTLLPAIQEAIADQLPKDDLAIPAFLQRKKLDPEAEQVKAEQDATKKAKARGRIEKMKAKQRGDLKKMPLSGKAALAAIRA